MDADAFGFGRDKGADFGNRQRGLLRWGTILRWFVFGAAGELGGGGVGGVEQVVTLTALINCSAGAGLGFSSVTSYRILHLSHMQVTTSNLGRTGHRA